MCTHVGQVCFATGPLASCSHAHRGRISAPPVTHCSPLSYAPQSRYALLLTPTLNARDTHSPLKRTESLRSGRRPAWTRPATLWRRGRASTTDSKQWHHPEAQGQGQGGRAGGGPASPRGLARSQGSAGAGPARAAATGNLERLARSSGGCGLLPHDQGLMSCWPMVSSNEMHVCRQWRPREAGCTGCFVEHSGRARATILDSLLQSLGRRDDFGVHLHGVTKGCTARATCARRRIQHACRACGR